MQALCSKFDNWGTGHQVIEKAYLVSLSPHIFSLIEDIILFWHLISLPISSLEIHGVYDLHLWIFSFKASNSPICMKCQIVIKQVHSYFCRMFLDCHLMVTNPLDYVDELVKAGASGFTFHVEVAQGVSSCTQVLEIPSSLLEMQQKLRICRVFQGIFKVYRSCGLLLFLNLIENVIFSRISSKSPLVFLVQELGFSITEALGCCFYS